MKVKVHYDTTTKIVKGFYPENVEYSTIPEPTIELLEKNIPEESFIEVMCVEGTKLVKYQEPTDL